MRMSDWSSDVCSSDLAQGPRLSRSRRKDSLQGLPGTRPRQRCARRKARQGARSATRFRRTDRPARSARCALDRKSTRLTPVTNAHLVCRLLLEKKKDKHIMRPLCTYEVSINYKSSK